MKPTYRVFITPTSLRADRVNPTDEVVRRLLERPPATRPTGWIIWPTSVAFDDKQFRGEGLEGTVLTLLYNGHLEYWEPLLSRRWQWGKSEKQAEQSPELYPYALIEITVNFLRLARQLYDHLRLDSDVQAQIDLYNVQGFVLRPYHPEIIGYIDAHFHRPSYSRTDLRTGIVEASSNFDPDQLGLRLLELVYGQFGYSREHIPFFDTDGGFALAPIRD